jgi:hypothetical protein
MTKTIMARGARTLKLRKDTVAASRFWRAKSIMQAANKHTIPKLIQRIGLLQLPE